MDWHELSANWHSMIDHLEARFPRIDRSCLCEPPRDSRALTSHLADVHGLTNEEARAALDEFMRSQNGSARRRRVPMMAQG